MTGTSVYIFSKLNKEKSRKLSFKTVQIDNNNNGMKNVDIYNSFSRTSTRGCLIAEEKRLMFLTRILFIQDFATVQTSFSKKESRFLYSGTKDIRYVDLICCRVGIIKNQCHSKVSNVTDKDDSADDDDDDDVA